MARPTSYDSKKHPKQVEKLLSEGYSKEACAGAMAISKQTLYNWTQKYREFFDAIKRGEASSQYFWEKMAIEALKDGRKFNATVWVFNMKNRFDWNADRVEKANTSNLGNEEEALAVLEELYPGTRKNFPFFRRLTEMNQEELSDFVKRKAPRS